MAASAAVIKDIRSPRRHIDGGMLAGIAVASMALTAGLAATGISPRYFIQPTGLLVVLGGTLGVMLMTTPRPALALALRRILDLLAPTAAPVRDEVAAEILAYSKVVRISGMLAIEPAIDGASDGFLRDALLLALDVKDRAELQSALENRIRLCDRQSETAAKVLEVAGGFTPTIGVLGTVIGLIDVLQQFGSLSTIAYGIGAAFTSTIYGLALANLLLLPAAYRIRARAAETFHLQELMAEGTLCLFDGMHPRIVSQRLSAFLSARPVLEHSPALSIESGRQSEEI